MGIGPDGEQLRRYETFHGTRTDALRYLEDECKKVRDTPAIRKGYTFKQFAEEKYLPHIKRKRRYRTHKGYKEKLTLHLYPRVGDKPLSALKPYHFEDVLDELEDAGMSAPTRVHVRRVAMQVMNYASRKGYIETWDSKKVEAPDAEKKPRDTLSPYEAVKWLDAFTGHGMEVAVAFGLCGLRPSEIVGVQHPDVDVENRLVWVNRSVHRAKIEDVPEGFIVEDTKTAESKAPVPLTRRAVAAYKRHQGVSGYVLQRNDGRPLTVDMVRDRVKKHAEDSGLRYVSPKNLRHTTATLAVKHHGKRTTTLAAVAGQLRHATQTTTEEYYIDRLKTVDRSVADVLDDIFG
jgi:integrase